MKKLLILISTLLLLQTGANAWNVDEEYRVLSNDTGGLESLQKKLKEYAIINVYLQGIFDTRMMLRDIDVCCYHSFMDDFKNYPLLDTAKKCNNKKQSFIDYFLAMYQRKEFDVNEDMRIALRKLSYHACPKVK